MKNKEMMPMVLLFKTEEDMKYLASHWNVIIGISWKRQLMKELAVN